MSKIDTYKKLLLEEERLTLEIEISKITIEENIKSYLNPRNLYGFFEEKLQENIDQDFSGDLNLKDYLISLSIDFIYEKATSSLLKSSEEKKSFIDWKLMAKPLVDKIYVANKHYITDIVSDYVDKGIKKWTNR